MDVYTGFTLDPTQMYRYISGFFMNPSVYIIIFAILLLFIILFFSLGNTKDETTSSSSSKIIVTIIVIIAFIIFIVNIVPRRFWNIFNLFGLNATADIHNTFSGNPIIDVAVQQPQTATIPEIRMYEEVFNIPGNYYGYDDAKTLCQAYGARLAKYEEVENTYNQGGEWCNYGWSEDQMALFPTQAETYKNLQRIPGHEHDCGRPGVNGGYIANPHVRFGVNCFGHKPKMTKEEQELMETTSPYPLTKKDILMDKRVDYWKQKLDSILVSPFNYNNWSKI